MARYSATVQTSKPIKETFDYLSDFSTTEEWDPGTTAAERLDDGPVGEGARFKLRAVFMGRESELVYEITEFEAPRRVVLRGENRAVVSTDEMTFDPVDGGTRVTYDADLRFKGLVRLAEPLLAREFRRVGDRALLGMQNALGD